MVNFNWYQSSREEKAYWGNKTNPIDRQAKMMCCFKCNLANFAWDCISFSSRNYINNVMNSDQVHFTLFNVDSLINDLNIKISSLVKKALGRAVLDSASSQTVAGEIWFNTFLDTLEKTAKFKSTFCFWDEVEVKAIKAVKFPLTLVGVKGVRVHIVVDIF